MWHEYTYSPYTVFTYLYLTVSTKNTSFAFVSVKLLLGMNKNLVPPKIGWAIFRHAYIAPLHSGP